ncbi:hypothetical protein ACHAXA_009811, partial [Cyclostephanos tholiformis]
DVPSINGRSNIHADGDTNQLTDKKNHQLISRRSLYRRAFQPVHADGDTNQNTDRTTLSDTNFFPIDGHNKVNADGEPNCSTIIRFGSPNDRYTNFNVDSSDWSSIRKADSCTTNIIIPNLSADGAANIQSNKASYTAAVKAAKFGSKCAVVRDFDCFSKRLHFRSERNAIFISKFD